MKQCQGTVPKKKFHKESSSVHTPCNVKRRAAMPQIKSPSDTTIYRSALNQILPEDRQGYNILLPGMRNQNQRGYPPFVNVLDFNVAGNSRFEHSPAEMRRDRQKRTDNSDEVQDPSTPTRDEERAKVEKARKRAEGMIIEAEHQRADVIAPKGNEILFGNNQEGIVNNVDALTDLVKQIVKQVKEEDVDDEFFHITCHIDAGIKNKIERGEFVELERLLPKSRTQIMNEDRCLQLWSKNGITYVAPEQGPKINGIRK